MRLGVQHRRPRVLIAGGGVAALEAALALRDLAGERLEVELARPAPSSSTALSPSASPTARPRSSATTSTRWRSGCGAPSASAASSPSTPGAGLATARDGERIPYDYLAGRLRGAHALGGARARSPSGGSPTKGASARVVRRLRAGTLRDVVFTMPGGHSWTLPVYELALLGATVLAKSGIEDAKLTVVTPEDAPLELFGRAVGEQMGQLLASTGSRSSPAPTRSSSRAGDCASLPASRSRPRRSSACPGSRVAASTASPPTPDGFLPVDEHCRVAGARARLRRRRRHRLPGQAGWDRHPAGRRRRRSDRRRRRLSSSSRCPSTRCCAACSGPAASRATSTGG